MYSDTHFHLPLVSQWIEGFSGSDFFIELCKNNCQFAQDIGTKCDDLPGRMQFVENAIATMQPEQQNQVRKMIHFSAGIWPDTDAIRDRVEQMKTLSQHIGDGSTISAVGECGIDHHCNPSSVDEMYEGERDLFMMQLALAKKLDKPVIVHSRDGFEDTLDCIKHMSYDKGVIHCYSYGLEEARAFLDRGWYISFSGSVTYTKKSKMETMENLIRFIPEDRILLETDAPYLAPVPFRGTPNTPLLVAHTYAFVAKIRNCPVEELCDLVDQNARTLFA